MIASHIRFVTATWQPFLIWAFPTKSLFTTTTDAWLQILQQAVQNENSFTHKHQTHVLNMYKTPQILNGRIWHSHKETRFWQRKELLFPPALLGLIDKGVVCSERELAGIEQTSQFLVEQTVFQSAGKNSIFLTCDISITLIQNKLSLAHQAIFTLYFLPYACPLILTANDNFFFPLVYSGFSFSVQICPVVWIQVSSSPDAPWPPK